MTTQTLKITQLANAGVLSGTEVVPVVQGGITKQVTTQQIADLFTGGGSGTVTSVGLSAPSFLTVSGSPVTTSGTLALSLATQNANQVFVGPATGPASAPTFRALVAADIPNGLPTGGTTGQVLAKTSGTDYATQWISAPTGSVTSVDATVPASLLTVSGVPITTSGTIAIGLATQSANLVFAGPSSGVATAPTFRSIVDNDLPVVSVVKGGTGLSSYAVGDILYADSGTSLARLADIATGNALLSGGVGVAPSWGKVDVTTTITGTLPIANGGTGQTTAETAFNALAPTTTRGDLIYRNATTNTRLAASTSGYLLQTNGAGTDPTWSGFLQAGTGAVTRTWQAKARDALHIADFGGVADWNGTTGTDNATAFSNADAAASALGGADILLGPGSYYVGSTVTINARNRIMGQARPGVPITNSAIIGALAVTPVLKLDGGAGSRSVAAFNLSVGRETGAVPSGAVGLEVTRSDVAVLEDVYSRGHEYGYKINTVAVGTNLTRCLSGAISKAHVWWTNGPELTLSDCRFGRNGALDVACEAYIRVEPGVGASIDGLRANMTHFNQSGATVGALIDFVGYTGTNGEFLFTSCHAEAFSSPGYVVKADAATTELRRIKFVGGVITQSGQNFFSVDPAANLSNFEMIGLTTAFNVNLGAGSGSDYQVVGCFIEGNLSCTGGDNVSIVGNTVTGNVTLSGTITKLGFDANNIVGSTSNTATVTTYSTLYAGSIDLGAASDTTITRSAAGIIAVEGVDQVNLSASQTLTNKTLTSPTITTGLATSTVAATAPLRSVNTNDSANVVGLRVEGDRAIPAANDIVYAAWVLSNASGTQVDMAKIAASATTVTAAAENANIIFSAMNAGAMTDRMVLTSANLRPNTNGGLALGAAATSWSNLFLASAGVIGWNNGNLTMTHSAGAMAATGVWTLASATATPANGSTSARMLFGTTANFGIYYGSGAPTVSAAQGSLYLRSDGTTTNDRMYVNNSSGSGTTWTAVTTAA